VRVGALLRPLVGLSDHDNLLAGVTAGEDDGDLAGLVDCARGGSAKAHL
jgi:hypothetical protein